LWLLSSLVHQHTLALISPPTTVYICPWAVQVQGAVLQQCHCGGAQQEAH